MSTACNHTDHATAGPDVNLPESLFVPVIKSAEHPDAGETMEALKAVNPDGVPVPVAFTTLAAMQSFVALVGLSDPGLSGVAVPTNDLLDQLAAAGELELHIDPALEGERVLRHSNPSQVIRKPLPEAGEGFEVRQPSTPLTAEHQATLRAAAAGLPAVEEVWLMELSITGEAGSSVRPLVVVRQSLPAEHEQFHEAFMELGNRWCDTLPRGMAVDMLPHDAPPVMGQLAEGCRIYARVGG